MENSMVRFEHVTREFGLKKAVDDVTFDIPKGAVVALVGPNGAGKSTLLRLSAALLRPTEGEIVIDGHPVTQNPRDVHRRIGFLPDFFGLYEELTVWDYLDYFSRAYRIPADERSQVLERALEQAGLTEQRTEHISLLSRGMRQRVGIARAMIPDPPVLFLDEPTAGVDPDLRMHLQQLFKDLAQAGKTLVVSSHLLQELEDYCSHVAIMNHARLVDYGTLDEIRQRIHPGRWILVRTAAPESRLPATLSTMPGISDAAGADRDFRFSFEGSDDALARVLQSLVAGGIPVTQFVEEKKSIQDAYMRTMQGGVPS